MHANPIPDESQPLSPYLIVKGAAQAIAFYLGAFGARGGVPPEGPCGARSVTQRSRSAPRVSCSRTSTPTSER